MKKTLTLFLICAVVCAFFTSLSSDNSENFEDSLPTPVSANNIQAVKWSYEEFAQHSTNIILAKYNETIITEPVKGYPVIEYLFSVVSQLKGKIDEDEIFVRVTSRDNAPYISTEAFLDRSEQLLLLSKKASVYQPHDYYLLNGNNAADDIGNIDTFADEITAVDLSAQHAPRIDFTRSDNMDDVMSVSENIFEIEITDTYLEGRYAPTTTYRCSVKNVIRGLASSSDILITFFNDTVEVGKSYIVLLPYEDADCKLYSLSSPEKSVYTLKEAAQISQINSVMASRSSSGNVPPAPKTDAEIFADAQEYYFGKSS